MAVLVDCARESLLGGLSQDEQPEREVAAAIRDDLALARAIREKVAMAVDALSVDSHGDAVEAARALTAASTALKTSQDVVHKALGKDKFEGEANDELPTLLIREMTAAEIEAERDKQSALNDDPYSCDDPLVAQS